MQVANQLWVLLGAGFALTLFLMPPYLWAAGKLRLVDRPAHRKIHTQPVITMGGLPIFFSLGLVLLIFSLMGRYPGTVLLPHASVSMKIVAVYGAGLVMALWGAVDDSYHFSSRTKFAGQFITAFLFALFGYRFEVLHIPGFAIYPMPDVMAVAVTVFWILAVINAFNMVDGIDGLASSICIVTLFFIAAAAALFDNGSEMGMAFTALGVVAGFLFFNWKPARLYLGDSGSSGLGMFIAGCLVGLGHSNPLFQEGPVTQPFQPFHYQILIVSLFIAYPVLEINLSVFRRIFRGRPVHLADQGHIHHRLLKKGWTQAGIVSVAVIVSLLPGLAAISTIMGLKGWASWYMTLSALALGLGLPMLGFLDFLGPRFLTRQRPHYQIAHYFISMQMIKLGLAQTREDVLALVDQTCQELGVKSYRLLISPDDCQKGGLDYFHTLSDSENSGLRGTRDSVKLMGGKGGAEWTFEPRAEEEELDMEYRVIISEFMRNALKILSCLGRGMVTLELKSGHNLSRRNISGHQLQKKRKA